MIRRGVTIGLFLLSCGLAAGSTAARGAFQESDLRGQFESAVRQWKQAAKDALLARQKYVICERDEAEQILDDWTRAVQMGREQYNQALRVATEVVERFPQQLTPDMAALVAAAITSNYENGNYEVSAQLCDKVLSSAPRPPASILASRLLSAFALNDFQTCKSFLEQYKQLGVPLSEQMQTIDQHLDALSVIWEREQALRAQEAERDDLPRVRLVCDVDGENEVILELFADQAPRNVANFMSLVQRGFYDNLSFHQVLTHISARSGSPSGDGSDVPNQLVEGEANLPDARHAFRGAVAMASVADQNRHGTEFYIALSPSIDNSVNATIIGRVVSGMDVINKLNITHLSNLEKQTFDRIDGVPASKILKAEVIRDRGRDDVPDEIPDAVGGKPGKRSRDGQQNGSL